MYISTGAALPSSVTNLGLVIGDGFSRAQQTSLTKITPASESVAFEQAKSKLEAKANALGASAVVHTQVIINREMMTAVNDAIQRTSYPAYEVILVGTAIK